MRKNLTLMTCLLLIIGVGRLSAAYTAPQSGKVYRIHNSKNAKVIGEDGIARELVAIDAAADDFTQLWLLEESNNGFLVQNAYSGQYLQACAQQSTQVYPTDAVKNVMYIKNVSGTAYSIGQTTGAYLHLDGGNNIVRWWDASNTASQWHFEEVSVSAEAVALQQAAFKAFYEEYQARLELMNHVDEYNAALPTFFTDLTCTELKPAYAAMGDDELRTAMSAFPATLQDMAVKIKNAAWGHREEEFRIRKYKAYSDADYWYEKLYTKKLCRINNPTGVYGNAGDVLYVFVGTDTPEGATLHAEIISGTGVQGESTVLKKGLNMIPVKKNSSNLFIQYVGTTSLDSDVLITDYPELKIHVEQGVVNGYWDIAEHDDTDWVDMKTNLFTSDVVQVKGERMLFHMSRKYITECCPTTITDAIGWWDDMSRWQQDMLGIEDVRLSKFNNLGCAISLSSGYQSATHYRTQYAEDYINNLLPYEKMMSNADNCWGPAHENGHVYQAAIQSVGTSEVTNNFFSNLTLFKLGRYTSRGSSNDVIFNDYGNHTPYILRDGATTMRLFWQLYLYFHEVKGDNTFFPRVFQAMRATPLKARDPQYYAHHVYGNEDLLIFAKVCCDVAQMDLSEFFRYWGYLELTEEQHIGDYGDFYLTTRQSDVDEFLAHAAQYPKAPAIIFIEDRVKAEARTDGGEGNKQHHGNAVRVGEAGDMGHYTDYANTNVKAEGYFYDREDEKITITSGNGALGFKVYAKRDGSLLYGSNRLSFSLPKEYATTEVYIVAAQADGTDVSVEHLIVNVPEAEQTTMLRKKIESAKKYIAMADATGDKAGYFIIDSVASLSNIVERIEQAIENKDASEYSYAEWIDILESTVFELINNPNARIPVYSNCYYTIFSKENPLYSICYASAGLKTTSAGMEAYENQWLMEPASEEGVYYLKNRESGYYISAANDGVRAKAAAKTTGSALAFRLVAGEPGEFMLQRTDDEGEGINLCFDTSNRQLKGGKSTSATAYWSLVLADDLLSLPEEGTEGKVIIYHIQCVDNGSYLYKSNNKRTEGRVATGQYSSTDDEEYWFYFTKAGINGDKIRIYNYATGKSITLEGGNYYANKDIDVFTEYTFTAAADRSGLTITSADGNWYVAGSNLTANATEQSRFRLIKIAEATNTSIEETVDDTEANTAYYDLTGRVVAKPTKGIYIHEGKKVMIR